MDHGKLFVLPKIELVCKAKPVEFGSVQFTNSALSEGVMKMLAGTVASTCQVLAVSRAVSLKKSSSRVSTVP